MPVETRSIRDRSAVGRFPSVSLFADDAEVEREEPEVEKDATKDNLCRQWLRKVCPCCCPAPDDDDDDNVTDTVVTGDETDDEKPDPGDGNLDGKEISL